MCLYIDIESTVFVFLVDYCQKLWKSLRDKYTRTKRDMGRSGAAAPEYGWHLFDKMLFYEKFTKPRP